MSAFHQRRKDGDFLLDKSRLLKRDPLFGFLLDDGAFQRRDVLAKHRDTLGQRIGTGGEQRHLLLHHLGRGLGQSPGEAQGGAALGLGRQANFGRPRGVQRNFIVGEIGGHILILEPVENIAPGDDPAKPGLDLDNRSGKPALHELHLRRGENHPFGADLFVDLGIYRPDDGDDTEDRDQDIEDLSLDAGRFRQHLRRRMIHRRAAHGHRRRAEQLVEQPADGEEDQPQHPANEAEGKQQDGFDQCHRKTPVTVASSWWRRPHRPEPASSPRRVVRRPRSCRPRQPAPCPPSAASRRDA